MTQLDTHALDALSASFQHHCLSPEVSVNEYMRRKMESLAAWVLERKRLYLDTCWWIRLRDVALGRTKDGRHEELFLRLQSLVDSGRLICPVGEGVVLEVLKQSDLATRQASTRLMDEFSCGVAIIDSRHRARVEAIYFLAETITTRVMAGPPIDRVWTKVSLALGTPCPTFEDVSPEKQAAIQKSFIDTLWSLSLTDFLQDGLHANSNDLILRAGAKKIATASADHAHEMRSFSQVFLAEVGGFVDLYSDALGVAFENLYKLTHHGAPPITPTERRAAQDLARRTFYNLFLYKKIGSALPIVNIYAGLHAMNRWQKTRPFRATDFYDFAHASAAIPYCNYFLTEHHLASVSTSPLLRFDKRYGLTVMHTVDQAMNELQGIS